MRYERFWFYTILLTAMACSRETPAPPPTTTTTAPPAAVTSSRAPVPPAMGGSYEEAMLWFSSASAFQFVLDEGGVRAEGNLTRRTVGSETIQIRVNGQEWRASSGIKGVTWERRNGTSWKVADAPPYGNRVYQRVTLAFDPEKKEGKAQLVEANHYRFTNANTGEVHDVWITDDNRVERIRIGDAVELKVESPKR
jgi:hypothetical protein